MYNHLKNAIKTAVFRMLPKDRVLFESYPDFADNTRCVYDELVRRGYNNKYKFVWILQDDDSERCPKDDNVTCISLNNQKAYSFHVRRAKAVISCNRILASYVPEQFSIYLDHGTPFKQCNSYLHAPQDAHLGYYLSTSPQTESLRRDFLRLQEDTQIVSFGFPRNDVFGEPKLNFQGLFDTQFRTFIAWYPTFRNHKYEKRDEGGDPLPVIHDELKAEELNKIAARNGVLIIIKPHPVQNLEYMKKKQFSNIVFIDDSFFEKQGITNYGFLNSCDALLSDYSSVFLDYLLADRPIGLVWEDIDRYQKDLGLIDTYEYLASGCEKIYDIQDLIAFVEDVASGRDPAQQIRRQIRDYVHVTSWDHSTENVTDFIIHNAEL